MLNLKVTPAQALLMWDCLDAVLRSGKVVVPDALAEMIDLKRQLERFPHVKRALRDYAKAQEAQHAVEKK